MSTQGTSPADRLQQIAERPVRLIAMICHMILGLALIVAIIVKAYTTVLTDHQCVADGTSLGNLLRCEPMLGIMAAILALSAGIELAKTLFTETMDRIVAPIMLALAATMAALLSGFPDGAGWREALLVISLVAAIGGIAWIGKTLLRN